MLVELLVALALLSFIVVGLAGGLRFGFKVWQQGNARADHDQRVIVAQNFLRQVIGDLYPFFVGDDPARGRVDFDGRADAMEFLSAAPIALGHGGRLRFRLFLDRQGGHVALAMTALPELADPQGGAAAIRRALLDDVASVEFSYFGKGRADKQARWRDDWANETALPQVVRIRVPPAAAEARAWPELAVAPRLNVDQGCVYDVLTKRCRGR
jgi:general secretion pathway protein J